MFLSPLGERLGEGVREGLLDFRPCAIGILHNVIRPEANDTPAFTFHSRSPSSVGINLKSVMIAVNLDDEFPRYAREVCKVSSDRVLSSELQAAHAAIS